MVRFEFERKGTWRREKKRSDSRRLESKIGLEVLSDLSDESLEGELSDEELSRLLVSSNLTESDSSGS